MDYEKLSDFDVRAAVCLGLGMSQEQAGEHLGCARQTVANHLAKNSKFFDQIVPEVQAIRLKTNTRSEIVAGVKAEDRIKGLFDRSLKITEKLIDQAEELGDTITIEQAMDIHKNLTQWAAKYSASEAPKKLQVNTEHTEVHVIDEQSIARIEAFMAKHAALLPPADVRDAELVS